MNLSMIKQALELKSKLSKAQKELAKTLIEVDVEQGAVKVIVTGQQKIKSIKISPEVIDPTKAKRLEGLVLKAVSEALDKSEKMAAKQLKSLTGGLNIPGLT